MNTPGKKIGYWSVISIGVGGMVGGGIFAVLGLSVQMTRSAAPEAFMAAGLVITTGATLLVANLFDLSSISTMGSAGFLLIFACVNLANIVLAERTRSRRWISGLGVLFCLGALASLIRYTLKSAPAHIWVLAAMLALAFLIEAVYRLWRKYRSTA